MSTRFYLQTRGKTIDYRFLYASPSREWWRDYAEYTLFEDETIILERLSNGECGFYLSGIPSTRSDRVNTVIRYTLVAELGKGEGSENFQLVKQFLDDCCNKRNTLGKSLDSCFQEPDDIEDALRSNEKCQDQISQKIANLVKSGSKPSSYDQYLEGIWRGGIKNKNSREKWLSLANQILINNGEPGVAALLNATSEKSLPSLKEKLHDKGILNAFILLTDNDAIPQRIEDPKKKGGEIVRNVKGVIDDIKGVLDDIVAPPQTRVYVGASVLVSALIFLVFMLAR